jgi:hypothetical protein
MSTYVVEVNEGVVEASRQGVTWWHLYRARFDHTGRIRQAKEPCIVGGIAEVTCDSQEDARWLADHMVEHGGLPRTAVRVKTATPTP